jgi:hypothetical protein
MWLAATLIVERTVMAVGAQWEHVTLSLQENGWGHELYGGFAPTNPYDIVRDQILGALGSMAAGRW